MSIVSDFRLRMYAYTLEKKLKAQKVQRKSVDFQSAKKIGILFDVTPPEAKSVVENYSKSLINNGKEVELLAYIDDNARHNDFTFKHFNKKDLNMYQQPKISMVTEFMNNPFDILICLFTNEIMPLEYVAALSKAHLRVGPYHDSKTFCYELMIDTSEGEDLKNFVGQVDYFLKIINRKDEELV